MEQRKIIRRDTKTSVRPRAFEELLNRQHVNFYNTHWELRKPIGVYNVTFSNVLESFTEVLDELEAVIDQKIFMEIPPTQRWDTKLMRRQEDLLSRLMRYFDDCFNMLCCFFPRAKIDMKIKALRRDQQQIQKNTHIQAAWDAVSDYRDHVANIFNHIKHHQGVLRGVIVFNENGVIPGYFVEHVNQDEALEPHPLVHHEVNGQATAFSFFRDLRYMLWIVYVVGEYVADAISRIESSITPNTLDIGDEDNIITVVSRVAALPKRVFTNEANQHFPHILVTQEVGVTRILMEYPSDKVILIPPTGTQTVVTGWIGDGVTKSFRPPYFSGLDSQGRSYDLKNSKPK